jgi:hypothetical protein
MLIRCLSGKGIIEREGAIVVLLGNVVGGVYRFFVRRKQAQ